MNIPPDKVYDICPLFSFERYKSEISNRLKIYVTIWVRHNIIRYDIIYLTQIYRYTTETSPKIVWVNDCYKIK